MNGLYPGFESPLPEEEDVYIDGGTLAYYWGKLEKIAEELGVTSLASFVDEATMLREILSDHEMPENVPDVRWFAPAEGLATVRGLQVYATEHPDEFPEFDALRTDFSNLETLLVAAERANVRFHLLFDI